MQEHNNYSKSPVAAIDYDYDEVPSFETIFRIWESRGIIQVKELGRITGYTTRYLHRVLIDHVGLSPKQMRNQMRFQNAMQLLERSEWVDHTDVALYTDFSDQAHYTREFKRFSGYTLGEYMMRKGI